MTHAVERDGYIPHIDGLRAVAVLSVILYHLKASLLPGGFTGVDVFFVISGFVVSASVARLPPLGGVAGVLRFYARRMRRIMPALLVCLLSTALLSALFIPDSWLSETSTKTGRMAFVGLSNWVLAASSNDYFSPRSEFNAYTHTWSLGVEEQFYVLFPLLFLPWMRGGRGRLLSLSLYGVATLASLAYAIYKTQGAEGSTEGFYLTTTRFWQLGAGVVLFQVMALMGAFRPDAGTARPAQWWRTLLAVVSLALLGYGLWSARPGHSPWMDGLWPVLGTLGLLALLQGGRGGFVGGLLSLPPLLVIGRLSYSLYLWHWPVFVLFRWTVGLDGWLHAGLALGCTALLAWASWRWVEQPLRFGSRWRTSDARWVAVGVAVLVFGALLQSQLDKGRQYISLSTVSRHPKDWYAYAKGLRKEYPDCVLAVSRQSVNGVTAQVFERGECRMPSSAGQRQLFVAGDSHALAYGEMFRRLTVLEGGSVRLYGTGGCALVGLRGREQADPACAGYISNVLADVMTHARAGDVLFLPGLRIPRLAEQFELFNAAQVMDGLHGEQAIRDQDVAAANQSLRTLAERGVHVVLEAPKPLLQAPPYRCSDAFNRNNPICVNGMPIERARVDALRDPAMASLRQIVATLPNTSLWDPINTLCPGATCTPDQDGRPLYFDADHLSGYGNRALLPSFQAHLQSLGSARKS